MTEGERRRSPWVELPLGFGCGVLANVTVFGLASAVGVVLAMVFTVLLQGTCVAAFFVGSNT